MPLLKRYGPVFVAGLLVVGAGTATGQRPSSNSDAEFARGVKLQQAGDLAGACRAYEAALRLSPRRIDALSNLGLAYGGMHQYERAIRSFVKALEIDPKQ